MSPAALADLGVALGAVAAHHELMEITLPNTEYDRGFEAGALAGLDAITNFLTFKANEPMIAQMVEDAWNSNTLVEQPPAKTLDVVEN